MHPPIRGVASKHAHDFLPDFAKDDQIDIECVRDRRSIVPAVQYLNDGGQPRGLFSNITPSALT